MNDEWGGKFGPRRQQAEEVREFSFQNGGWIERKAFTVSMAVDQMRQHPGMVRELYLANNMPLLTAGPRTLKVDCTTLTRQEAQSLAGELQKQPALRVMLAQGLEVSDHAAYCLVGALDGAKAVALEKLSWLEMDLSGPLEKAMAGNLAANGWLQELSLANCTISDNGAAGLAQSLRINRSLEVLDFDAVKIGDEGAVRLAEALYFNKTLQRLCLKDNNISDRAAKSIADALRVNRGLRRLDLRGNVISDAGVEVIGDALLTNLTLQRLDLRGNKVSEAGGNAMSRRLRGHPTLQKVYLWEEVGISETFKNADSSNFAPAGG